MLNDVLLRGAAMAACIGLMVGITQWALIRETWRKASYWPLISLLAWVTGGAVYWVVYTWVGGPLLGPYSDLPGAATDVNAYNSAKMGALFISWIVGGLVVGSLTGIAMKRFLSRRNTDFLKREEP